MACRRGNRRVSTAANDAKERPGTSPGRGKRSIIAMAKLTGPLLSFGARGQIGKAMVVAKWRGIDYARQYVVPANPQTTAQQLNRSMFAMLREMWKLSPAAVRAPWTSFAQGRPFLPVNKYVGENIRLLNGTTDLQAMIMSPGAKGGLPPSSVSAAAGGATGEIDVTVNVPTQLPDGWSITEIAATAVVDQIPTGLFSGNYVADTEANPANDITLTGFQAAEDCVAFGWVVYEKPDGTLAYSVSVADTVTSGA